MNKEKEVKLLLKTGITVAFIALSFLGTLLIRIPIPGAGYVNLGDTFVMMAGVFFGPLIGFMTGLVGPALADLIGFPSFVPATAVVKGVEGLAVGLLAHRTKRISAKAFGLAVGVAVIVAGYFVFEAYVYPALAESIPFFGVTDYSAAIIELGPNALQGGVSAVITLAICRLFQRDAEPELTIAGENGVKKDAE